MIEFPPFCLILITIMNLKYGGLPNRSGMSQQYQKYKYHLPRGGQREEEWNQGNWSFERNPEGRNRNGNERG